MKKKSTISKLGATAALAIVSISASFAQSDLGKNCGCPPVASRSTILLSTLAAPGGPIDGELLNSNTILTCDKTWILDKKIYVPDGKSLTIQPGTVIKGRAVSDPAQATALIVERGGKIFADGDADCQIVFTAEADPLDGSYPIANRGKWGGVVILGKATNNMKACDVNTGGPDGVGFIEGFNAADPRNLYGEPVGSADDNDNSGVFEYVSIRHSGAILSVGNELNGLSLGSVGRGTTVEHVEIISSDDDGIELFGGTVNLKYCVAMFGADDMFDWDLGWSGKAQFLFGIKTDGTTAPSADNGFEADADDDKSNALPRSHPVIYNATLIGNGNAVSIGDNTGPAAIMAKELTEGEVYSSVFANFAYGFNVVKALGGAKSCGSRTLEAYDNWISGSLKVQCNAFVGNTNSFTIDKVAGAGSDLAKFTSDGNTTPATIPGFDFVLTQNTTTNSVSHPYDAVPNPNLATTCTAPVDGFFTAAPYRGAFDGTKKSWMSDWAYAALLKVTSGIVPCPTDVNNDGITNNVDFLQVLGQFNQSCK